MLLYSIFFYRYDIMGLQIIFFFFLIWYLVWHKHCVNSIVTNKKRYNITQTCFCATFCQWKWWKMNKNTWQIKNSNINNKTSFATKRIKFDYYQSNLISQICFYATFCQWKYIDFFFLFFLGSSPVQKKEKWRASSIYLKMPRWCSST